MKKYFSFSIFSSMLLSIATAELPEPYNSVNPVLPYYAYPWWYNNSSQIATLFQNYNIRTVVEVGCWVGDSTRHLATLVGPYGKVYAIDHWLGSIEHQSGGPNWDSILPKLYEQFLSNVIHTHLENIIVPVRMASIDAAKLDIFSKKIVVPDLIYIDASHDTDSVYADLTTWWKYVKGHGILCGDDWGWGSVQTAVIRFADEQNLNVESKNNFWRLVE